MHIEELQLEAARPEELLDFYTSLLGLPVERHPGGAVTVGVGRSDLVFVPAAADEEPYYHFAIDVPENQFEAARDWLDERVGLLADADGRTEFAVDFANADAVYFEDPAGNVGKLIARHDLDNASDAPFTSESLLELSEVGLPVSDVSAAVDALASAVGVESWDDAGDGFAVAGGDRGLFVVVALDRPWAVSGESARAFPATVVVSDVDGTDYAFPHQPYRVAVA